MKCKECDCCKKGWFKSKPNDYICIGVKEPFVIDDINVECTEYPEKRTETKMEYNFKVGDKVITSTGQTGVIESICDCKRCKERGFCEPNVKTINGVGKIYITDNDKRVGFKSFYQIGEYLFGNIDKESVGYDIENESRKIEEATNNMYTYKRQLERLNTIEDLGIKF